MGDVCEICKAASEPLLEFNRLLACASCFRGRIRSMADVEKALVRRVKL